jgi:polyisoprenoid-binding protein YceI
MKIEPSESAWLGLWGAEAERMSSWSFEPGHTAAEFQARHMMVTWVRGHFKDVHGRVDFDPGDPLATRFEGVIDATKLWTGEPARDEHLRSPDFFDVENYPEIRFGGRLAEREGALHYLGTSELTIRGRTREVPLAVTFQGEWTTPFWEGDVNRGTMRRIGFLVEANLSRHDFGVSWNDELPGGGVVVSNEIPLRIDVEAILDDDLRAVGLEDAVWEQGSGGCVPAEGNR